MFTCPKRKKIPLPMIYILPKSKHNPGKVNRGTGLFKENFL